METSTSFTGWHLTFEYSGWTTVVTDISIWNDHYSFHDSCHFLIILNSFLTQYSFNINRSSGHLQAQNCGNICLKIEALEQNNILQTFYKKEACIKFSWTIANGGFCTFRGEKNRPRQSNSFQSPLFNHEFSRSLWHTLQPALHTNANNTHMNGFTGRRVLITGTCSPEEKRSRTVTVC